MKTIFIVSLLLCLVDAIAQKPFRLVVKADTTIDTKKLRFYCNNGETLIYPSDTFSNGSVAVKGMYYSKFVTVTMVYYKNDSTQYYRQYWITGNTATIELKDINRGDLFDNCKLSNLLDIYNENKALVKRLQGYTMNELKKISELWERSNEYTSREAFDSAQKEYFISLMNKSSQYIKKHNSEYFYFWHFVNQFYEEGRNRYKNDTALNLAIRDSILSIFSPKFTSGFETKKIIREIDNYFYPRINIAAPSFTAKNIDGNSISIERYKGKYVLIDFWATWCPPCMREIPFIKKIRADIPEENLVIIGINKDRDYEKCRDAVAKHELNWLHIFDDQDKLYNLFGVSELPTTILINDKGIIIYNSKINQDKKQLMSLLKEL